MQQRRRTGTSDGDFVRFVHEADDGRRQGRRTSPRRTRPPLVGYDDIVAAQTAGIQLTLVRVDGHAIGHPAAGLLLPDEERDPRYKHRRILFAPRLVELASS